MKVERRGWKVVMFRRESGEAMVLGGCRGGGEGSSEDLWLLAQNKFHFVSAHFYRSSS